MPRVQLTTKKTSSKSPVTVKPTKTPTKKVAQAPESKAKPKHEITGLKLSQIMRATPPLIHNNAKEVLIRKISRKKTKLGLPAVVAKVQSVSRGRKLVFDTTIIAKESPDLPLYKQKVLIFCSCEFHTYYSEFALTKWGSSQIKYSNGEPAHVTNPGNIPLACKHVVALTKLIMEQKI